MIPVLLSKPDGRKRRRTAVDKSRKSGDKHRDAESDAYPRQGIGPHAFHMPDIDSVDDTV